MPKTKRVGNQIVEFPDSMSDEQINAAINQNQPTQPKEQTASQPKEQSFGEAHPYIKKGLEIGLPLAAGGLGEILGGPLGAATAMAATDYGIRRYEGEGDPNETPGASIVNFAADTLKNYTLGKAFEGGAKAIRAVHGLSISDQEILGNLYGLKPTFAQQTGSKTAKIIEDNLAPEAKAEAVQQSVKLARGQAEEMASNLAGRKVALTDLQGVARTLQDKTAKDYAAFTTEAGINAEEVKGIAKSGLNTQNFIVGQSAPTQFGPGQPIVRTIEGPVYPDNLVNKILQFKNDIAKNSNTPNPDNPFINDMDKLLADIGYKDNNGVPSYNPVDFEHAWNTKIGYGSKGFEGVDETGRDVNDARYQQLNKALNQDIRASLPQWVNGDKALKAFDNANKITQAKYTLFDNSQVKGVINLKGKEDPDVRINAILDDATKTKKFLVSNEYRLPDGTLISSTNKRADAKAYQFMRMWQDNFNANKVADLTAGKLNTDSFQTQWNLYKVSKEGKQIYNQQDIDNIDTFLGAISKVNTGKDGAGVSRYLTARMATGMFAVGSSTAAALLAGGQISSGTALGTTALSGALLTGRQIGKLLTNPKYAVIINKMALGEPLGKSLQGAMQMLAYGLRKEKIITLFSDGSQGTEQLDGQGNSGQK